MVSFNIFVGFFLRFKCFICFGGCCILSRVVVYFWLFLSIICFWLWLLILWLLSWRNLLLFFCNSILWILCEDFVYKGCSLYLERFLVCKICILYFYCDYFFELMIIICIIYLYCNFLCIFILGFFRYILCVIDDCWFLLKLRGIDFIWGMKKICDMVRCVFIWRLKLEVVLSYF